MLATAGMLIDPIGGGAKPSVEAPVNGAWDLVAPVEQVAQPAEMGLEGVVRAQRCQRRSPPRGATLEVKEIEREPANAALKPFSWFSIAMTSLTC
jgi:hypothetical protein